MNNLRRYVHLMVSCHRSICCAWFNKSGSYSFNAYFLFADILWIIQSILLWFGKIVEYIRENSFPKDKSACCLVLETKITQKYVQQESPPAWTQQAYCPPCSEYSFCCPILADPPLLDWSPPGWTADPPQLDWPPPSWTDPPLAGLTPPRLDWPTRPPQQDWFPLAGLTPPWLDWPPSPSESADWPPPMDRQTDMCQNITFPSYYVCGR